jgi:hypothetical protein
MDPTLEVFGQAVDALGFKDRHVVSPGPKRHVTAKLLHTLRHPAWDQSGEPVFLADQVQLLGKQCVLYFEKHLHRELHDCTVLSPHSLFVSVDYVHFFLRR